MPETVLVTGSTGFIGRAVVDALLQKGHTVRALVRSETNSLPTHPNLSVAVGDVRDLHALEATMAGVTAVVHLAAAKNDEKDSADINIGGAQNVIEACRIAGVKRVINVSTQSAKLPHKGLYGATKEEADRLFHASPLAVTTLRSSLVYGNKESGILGTIIRYSALPVMPMIGNGNAHFRPIHRDDLAAVITHALESPETANNIYDVGGPDLLSLQDITQNIMTARDVRHPILHLPVWLGLVIAGAASFLRHPPLTVSNVMGSAADVPMDMAPLQRDFAAVPLRSFEQGMTGLFGPPMTPEEREAKTLLHYVLSSVGTWEPDSATIALYLRACTAHGLAGTAPLPDRVLRSWWRLSALDSASRLCRPDALLRKKLLVAAAVAECQPASAEALLPRDRSLWFLIIRSIDLCLSALAKQIIALPYLLLPSSLARDAGTL